MTQMKLFATVLALGLAVTGPAFAHGDGAPQPVDTTGLDPLGEEWLGTNPYRTDEKKKAIAAEIGGRGYTSNCARCHGLDVKSGGMAPDLRALGEAQSDDAGFISRVLHGATLNGRQKMPPVEGLLSPEAIWAIRRYIDSQPED